ncbi:hypothetical protein [Rhizobium sp. MHM7A]|uniref:hypothetical protein n=1 Tax=Rhizobium sp. MHM7A TaxID=2583233 RepID=UPI001106BC2C|nr:hypothetical protein [Rhizobium sp. MHM7A]TLX16018.1 hypothetical protein FFR93_01485 [Rhizobium sp. MHM7A]
MTLYGIRKIYNDNVYPLSILAQAELSGETGEGLSSKKYLEVTAGVALTTHRKTLFLSEDLNFVAELYLDGVAWDFDEYFEFSRNGINTTYEVYNAITGEKVEIDINDPTLSEARANIERRQQQREQQRQFEEEQQRKKANLG